MLEQVARHGGFALELECKGDLEIDEHHTVEDCALALGQALRQALGDKRGIARYGFLLPMDEAPRAGRDRPVRPALCRLRRTLQSRGDRRACRPSSCRISSARWRESLGAAVHVSVQGENTHHMVEACFKGVGRALRQAFRIEGSDLPSSKGVL